jgi:hypothetical protein
MYRSKFERGLQRLLAMRKGRVWRAFLIERKKFSENRNGWLGREDSNLRMGESKSPALPLGDAPIDLTEPAAEYRLRISVRQRRSIERGEAFQPPKAAVTAANFALTRVERTAIS